PWVLAVGAGDANNGLCSFSATLGLTFYAPGCGLSVADPLTDRPTCCGNGTSQASAFAAAILVALIRYDAGLTYSKAEHLLVSTATTGHVDAAAAFQADNLGAIVTAGNATSPKRLCQRRQPQSSLQLGRDGSALPSARHDGARPGSCSSSAASAKPTG